MTVELCKWEMADPLKVVMSREQAAIKRSCAGCANARTVTNPFGESVIRCLKCRPYGQKCGMYERGDS